MGSEASVGARIFCSSHIHNISSGFPNLPAQISRTTFGQHLFPRAFSDPSSFSDPLQNQSDFTSNLPATSLPPHLQSHLHAHLQAHLQQNLHAHLQTYLQPVFIDPAEKEDHISNFEIQLMFAIPSEVKQGLGEEYGKEGGKKYSQSSYCSALHTPVSHLTDEEPEAQRR